MPKNCKRTVLKLSSIEGVDTCVLGHNI